VESSCGLWVPTPNLTRSWKDPVLFKEKHNNMNSQSYPRLHDKIADILTFDLEKNVTIAPLHDASINIKQLLLQAFFLISKNYEY